jgi:uncharacterized protein (TIGR00369 family)
MIALPPYALTLGIGLAQDGAQDGDADDAPLLHLPAADHLLGRPGFLHGGAIAGLLEIAGFVAARHALGDAPVAVKPIGMTVDYLRGGRETETFARGRVVRNGARIAAVEVHAWQDDPTSPIATARMNLSLKRA